MLVSIRSPQVGIKRLRLDDDEDLAPRRIREEQKPRGDDFEGWVRQLDWLIKRERQKWVDLRYRPASLLLKLKRHEVDGLYAFILCQTLEEAHRSVDLELSVSGGDLTLFGMHVKIDDTTRWPIVVLRKK